jgi:DNA polymerase-3 subunit gamma/tau
LRTGRINHAYLFSGPRGCGKTSSARILARSLNCEQGPTPDPCGVCESCVALAPTGPGHLDVIEIDAASHGGVDDARDLRERAFFAPVSARYKIYIIDEAHMVTREGFNALLKLVEEPPPHLKFIFATTEPEKVIGTIKSRTHHYPFRLMPPATLRALMEEILSSESVPFEPTALPLVVRAGAGSARDSLSILDQLLAGADDEGITYAKAVSLLGYTDGDLLDEVVAAFAAHDGAQVFHAVNRVIEGGHDPRRFASDLLERFRDLVILANVPEAASSGLLDRPADELERLVQQAASMGPAELTRAAEIFNNGLTEMRGATSPRLLLELMCARVLLPAAAQGEAALLARLERLERGGAVAHMAARSAGTSAAQSGPGTASAQTGPGTRAVQGGPGAVGPQAASGTPAVQDAAHGPSAATVSTPSGPALDSSGADTQARRAAADDWPETARPGAPAAQPAAATPPAHSQSGVTQSGVTAGGTATIQQQWPVVLAALKKRSIAAWSNVSTNAQVVGVEGNVVTLGFLQVGAMKNFTGGGKDAVVASALGDVLGGTWRVEAVVGGGSAPQQTSRGPQSGPHSGSPSGGLSGPHSGGPAGPHPGGPSGTHPGGPAGPHSGGSVRSPSDAHAGQGGASDAQTGTPSDPRPGMGQPGAGHSGTAPEAGQPGTAPGAGQSGSMGPHAGDAAGGQWGAAPDSPVGALGGPQAVVHQLAPQGVAVQADGAAPARSTALDDSARSTGPSSSDGRPTTDESWPSAPDDPGPGSPPTPDPSQASAGAGRRGGGAPGAGLAAARSAARAAAQAGPRLAGARKAASPASPAWPDAVPGRGKNADADDIDPLNDAGADVDAVSGMALLQRELGAQVIGEIDHS